ncbi:restriction endonuclease subunit S [Myroides marinus]|uniref:restriction endonuclease subunit S n=1 Tax=Myroides marinus TaxID=703342 RepID=UPI00257816E8|nr:restriction endonuclease subunit S [Myroides marinus]MDM1376725.1 restriction endonuclease subunit S [Myroides marinus]
MEQNKKVPSIRFKGFENEWSLVKLGEISSTFTDGDWIESKDQSFYGIRLVQTGNIGVNRFISKENSSKWISNETFNNLKCKEIFEGDILISRLPEPAGRSTILPKLKTKAITSVDCTVVRLKDEYINTFINQFLSSQNYFKTVNNLLAGGTRQRISRSNLYQIDLFSPSKFEQTQIGDFFKTLDSQINAQEQKHQKLINLKKAMLEKMFPKEGADVPEIRFKGFTEKWEEKKLGDVANIIGGGTPSTSVKEYWNGDINWFSPTEIGNSIYAYDSNKKITKLGLEKSSAKILPANKTILFTSRAGIGDMAILKKEAATNQGFQSLVVNNNFDVYFIFSLGKSIKKKAIIKASGSTFLEISGKTLGLLSFKFPSLEEQQKIGEYFKKLDNLIQQSQEQIKKYKNIKQALLQKMFV